MARNRTARSVKTVGLKPFVVDDVAAAPPPETPIEPSEAPMSLAGREQLDERRRQWELERERFERSRARRASTAASATSTGAEK